MHMPIVDSLFDLHLTANIFTGVAVPLWEPTFCYLEGGNWWGWGDRWQGRDDSG